jgi:GAF domain-containing protein
LCADRLFQLQPPLYRASIGDGAKLAHEQSKLSLEKRKSAHLGLLGEVGRQVINSLDEKEILERTLEIVVDRFGYAEATISLLVNDDILQVAAISGAQDFGHQRGFQQKISQGIIGMAETREAYVTEMYPGIHIIFPSCKGGSAIGSDAGEGKPAGHCERHKG